MTGAPSEGAPLPRLDAIEGFRAYLAYWVVICHAMWVSGYGAAELSVLPRLLLEGPYAVNVFIIISAFVIFLLLDRTRPPVGQFLIRRFFRLYPLFMTLFLVAIPLSLVDLWNIDHAGAYLSTKKISYLGRVIQESWADIHWHTLLHALMLNGAVPERLIPNAPGAFLDPAWSVSLEWQFYLVAPLAFGLAASRRPSRWIALAAGCAALYLIFLWPPLHVAYGAALPFHIGYFAIGALSYFLFRWYKRRPRRGAPFAAGCVLGVGVLLLRAADPLPLVPIALWLAFLGLILESHASWTWRLVSPVFTNRVALYLGRISYSLYLSHILVQTVVRHALLRFAPELGRVTHFSILLAATTAGTILASALLYRYVEQPGIRLGRQFAKDPRLQRFFEWARPSGSTATTRLGALPRHDA